MSFQTVLSIVGVAFTAFELYQRFRPKSSSGSAQSPISPQTEPKQSEQRSADELRADERSTLEASEDRKPERRLAKRPEKRRQFKNRNGLN